jgi:CBS domain-containing protein
MRSKVVTISPEATIAEVIHLLLHRKISGAPVVNDAGELVGIISEYQLLEVTYDAALAGHHVRSFMTTKVISVGPDTPLAEVVTLFVLHRIRRLPVVENGRLVGIISRRDVLRHMAGQSAKLDAVQAALVGSAAE